MTSLHTRLQRLQRAFAAQIFVARLVELSLAGALLWIAWVVWRFATGAPIWSPWLAAALVILELSAAAIWAWRTRPNLTRTAATIDQLGATRDRFTTALALQQPGSAVEMRAASECAQFLATFDERPWTRLHFSPRWAALLVPVVVTVLLIAAAQPPPLSSEEIAQREAANDRANELARLADQAAHSDSPAEKKIAEQMKQAAAKIERAPNAAEAEKTSLSAISAIEEALRNQAMAARKAELDALAKALGSQAATRDAAQRLQERNVSEAAEKLAEAARKIDQDAARKLAEAMKQALQQLGQASSDSPLARQMNALANARQPASEALQKLAQMLQQQSGPRSAQSSSQGRSPTEQELLNALENLKNQRPGAQRNSSSLAQNSGPAKPGEGKSPAKIVQGDFSSKPGTNRLAGNLPSGLPGSERDEGTTKTPFGSKSGRTNPEQQQTQLEGVLGQGESLQSLVESAGGSGQSSRRYRELYDAMAPAAEQTVEQENIPAGSRYLIKRYFESIRPAE